MNPLVAPTRDVGKGYSALADVLVDVTATMLRVLPTYKALPFLAVVAAKQGCCLRRLLELRLLDQIAGSMRRLCAISSGDERNEGVM